MKWKIKFIFRNIRDSIAPYFKLPHVWMLFFIIILTIITFVLSVVFFDSNSFISSVLANIFCGLLTGVVFSLITTIKSVSLYRTESLLEWLNDLHNDCLEFIKMHNKILFRKHDDFDSAESFYDYVYDTLSFGNGISSTISQGVYIKHLPFNTYKYCKNKFEFDAIKVMESNDEIREKVINSGFENISSLELRELFKTMENQILNLNINVLSEIKVLKIKKKSINISIG